MLSTISIKNAELASVHSEITEDPPQSFLDDQSLYRLILGSALLFAAPMLHVRALTLGHWAWRGKLCGTVTKCVASLSHALSRQVRQLFPEGHQI